MKGNINKFIEKANKVHNNKYDYKNAIYLGVDSKLEIICPIHGSFWQTPAVHLHGSGCPQCGLISRTNKRKHTKEEFIKRAREKHGDKFDYSKVNYINSRTKVCIICPKHGEFYQTPHSHLNYGCAKCSTEEVHDKQRFTTKEFITRAKNIHGNKYDYSKVNYLDGKSKVCIICPKHGEFEQRAHSHLLGYGCRKCSDAKNGLMHRSDKEQFIAKSSEIHYDFYNYDNVVYKDSKTPVCIICPKHGEFWQIPNIHLGGHGCPKCAKRKSQVKLYERLKSDLLIELDFDKRLNWLGQQSLDIYSHEYNFAIEYNGEQHYKPIDFFGGEEYYNKIIELDRTKKSLCDNNFCKLWIVKHDYTDEDYNNLLNEIKEFIDTKNKE